MSRKFTSRRGFVDRVITTHRPTAARAAAAYWRLIHVVRSHSTILRSREIRFQSRSNSVDCLCETLALIARRWDAWRAPLEQWQPRSGSARIQLRSLIDHLFVAYPMPPFMYRCWFERQRTYIPLFLRLAVGQRPHRAFKHQKLGFAVGKKMAVTFLSAPSQLTIAQAIRWAQAVAWGANHQLALELVQAHGRYRHHSDSFWQEIVRFFIRCSSATSKGNPALKLSIEEIFEIVQFLILQKFFSASQTLGYPTGDDRPLQPDFSLRGRTLRSLRRHIRNWKQEIAIPPPLRRQTGLRFLQWRPSGIQKYSVTKNGITYTIEELLDSHQLVVEGGMMNHCVATYARWCHLGITTIWSLKAGEAQRDKRLLTIEVCPQSKRLLQVRGKRNRAPTEDQQEIVRQWVGRAGLDWLPNGEADG